LTNELLIIKSATANTILSLSFLHRTKNEEDIATRRIMQDFVVRNSQETTQISPENLHPIYKEKKNPNHQPLKILIPKDDKEPLNQRHTCVTMVQSETIAPDMPHLPRTLRLLKKWQLIDQCCRGCDTHLRLCQLVEQHTTLRDKT